jgi:hypothetical protein
MNQFSRISLVGIAVVGFIALTGESCAEIGNTGPGGGGGGSSVASSAEQTDVCQALQDATDTQWGASQQEWLAAQTASEKGGSSHDTDYLQLNLATASLGFDQVDSASATTINDDLATYRSDLQAITDVTGGC